MTCWTTLKPGILIQRVLHGNLTSHALQSSEVARANGAAALMRPSIAHGNVQLDLRQQLANTPPPQSTTHQAFTP